MRTRVSPTKKTGCHPTKALVPGLAYPESAGVNRLIQTWDALGLEMEGS